MLVEKWLYLCNNSISNLGVLCAVIGDRTCCRDTVRVRGLLWRIPASFGKRWCQRCLGEIFHHTMSFTIIVITVVQKTGSVGCKRLLMLFD